MGCVNGDTPMNANDTTNIVFEVPKGSTANGISSQLVAQNLVPSEWQWKWFLRGEDASCLKAGKFRLQRAMSMRDLLQTMCGVPLADEIPFKVLEGWRILEIDAQLTAQGFIKAGEYKALAESKAVKIPFPIESETLEGYLFPETYMVAADKSAFNTKAFIERQLKMFHDRFYTQNKDALGTRTLGDVVTMASMLEREEPTESQRPIVAGILWKRLDNKWRLGVDATSRYTLEDWTDERAFRRLLKDSSDR